MKATGNKTSAHRNLRTASPLTTNVRLPGIPQHLQTLDTDVINDHPPQPATPASDVESDTLTG